MLAYSVTLSMTMYGRRYDTAKSMSSCQWLFVALLMKTWLDQWYPTVSDNML